MLNENSPTDIVLLLSGPEYAEMQLGREASYHPHVTIERLREITASGEALWGKESGAVLQWCEEQTFRNQTVLVPKNDCPSLAILYNSTAGFHVRFDSADGRSFIAFDPAGKNSSRITQSIGGMPAYFPRATFFTQGQAMDIIRVFVCDSVMCDSFQWQDSTEFDFHEPTAWKAFCSS